MGLTAAIVSISAIFSPLAGAMAFLIVYQEYLHHFTDKRMALRAGLEAGAFTLVVFLGIGIFLGFILPAIL